MKNSSNTRTSMEKVLEQKGYFVGIPVGDSMWPTIRNGIDSVLLIHSKEEIQRHEIVLYRRNSGQYVLHRVLEVTKNGYVLCGDSQWQKEYGVMTDCILGVVEGIYRREKYIACSDENYKTFVRIWCASLTFRKLILLPRFLLTRLRRKFLDS